MTPPATPIGPAASIPPPRRSVLRIGVPAVVLAAFALLVAFAFRDLLRPSLEVRAVPVAVRSIETSAASRSGREGDAILAPGWIEADPYMHQVVALADGVVEEMLVLEGAAVEAGQPVARLVADDARLAVARAEADLADAEAAVAGAEAVLAAARADRTHLVTPRKRVAAARAEVERLVAAAEAADASAVALDAAARELADELARLEQLADRGNASPAAVVRLRLRHEAATAAAQARRHETEVAERAVAVAEAERGAAIRDLELLVGETLAVERGEADLARLEARRDFAAARLEEATLRLDRMVVRSPIDGVVAELHAAPGSTLSASGPHGADVVHVFDPRRLGVRVDVPISEVGRVVVGQRVEIVVDTLPGVVLEGEVSRLVRRADLAKNTLPVKVRLLDPDPRLTPDMLARVRILARSDATDAGAATATVTRVFAPESAWADRAGGDRVESVAVVGVRDRRGVARRRMLVLGETRIDGWREVVEGLRPGEWIVLGDPPPDGAAVRILEDPTPEAIP